MITGIIAPTSGDIFINNRSLKGLNLNHYRGLIGQSIPDETPFEGTILDNITFGDTSITKDDVYWAIEKTGLAEFVKQQENGLNTMVYPEGRQFSNTVSKKIVLARSIVRKPKLLVLKDPLNQFAESEKREIMDFLFDKDNPWALIVASQDKIWQEYCQDRIYLNEGKINVLN